MKIKRFADNLGGTDEKCWSCYFGANDSVGAAAWTWICQSDTGLSLMCHFESPQADNFWKRKNRLIFECLVPSRCTLKTFCDEAKLFDTKCAHKKRQKSVGIFRRSLKRTILRWLSYKLGLREMWKHRKKRQEMTAVHVQIWWDTCMFGF